MQPAQLTVAASSGGAQVIPFVPRNVALRRNPARCAGGVRLTIVDRMALTGWVEEARRCGYDRMVIHDRASFDPPEVENYLSIYRRGQSWSRWGVARIDDRVEAWCCITGRDVGPFPTLAEALTAILLGDTAARPEDQRVAAGI